MKLRNLILPLAISIVSIASQAQIKGKVTDPAGKPISGATIMEVGTQNGGFTGFDGSFQLKKGGNGSLLKVSYLGYEPKDVTYNGGTLAVTLDPKATQGKTVQIVGSRNSKRTEVETPVPVDIINVNQVAQTMGQVDVNQILQYSAPSFNVNKQSGSDGSDHIMPATLRGMGPDQTLVLVDGKRYHQSSLVNIYGTRGRGNTGTDLNSIPTTAIEKVEILRDGASAQYGSDAIAGVMNIILKKNTGRLTGSAGYGFNQTGYGASLNSDEGKMLPMTRDGNQFNLGLNYGIDIKDGYINLTGEYTSKDRTNRPNQLTTDHPDSYRDKNGDPKYSNVNLLANFGKKLNDKFELYGNLGYGHRNGESYAWTRTADDARNIPSIYPNGFNPNIKATINDFQGTVGIKTELGKTDLDVYVNHGMNSFRYDIDQTLNSSMGANSPTSFYSGGFGLSQSLVGAQLTRNYENILSGLNLAGGVEYRKETYTLNAGDSNSWKSYDGASAAGAQGFPGFQPGDESNNSRNNLGLFVDAELDVTKAWLISGAARFENYSDFGSTTNWKLASRYKLNNNAILRGAISTGFRAPSLAQMYFSSTFTNVVAGNIQDQTLAPNNSALASALNMPKLKQETSTNVSIGMALTPDKNFTLTIDGYMVKVKDRIVLTGLFDNSIPEIATTLDNMKISAAQFFTNAVNTSTYGVDIVASAHSIANLDGNLALTFACNLNKMDVDQVYTNSTLSGYEDKYFGKREKAFLLASAPDAKFSLNMNQVWSRWTTNLRFTYFSPVKLVNWAQEEDYYNHRFVTDLSISHKLSRGLLLTLGGNNLFDVYPTRVNQANTEGGGMWDAVQMGNSGAYFYTKLGFNF